MKNKIKNKKITGRVSLEKFYHFNCGHCHKWWGIGDAPNKRKDWFCP
ncbi:MAG TPA: hypothetical protein PKZ16_01100 [bacterium]|nr:hypothetical protein [bacterium]HPL95479.1 hypothetical protein [bacterium]